MGSRTAAAISPTRTDPSVGGGDSQLERRWCVHGARASRIYRTLDYTKYTSESRQAAADVVLAVNREADEVHWATRAAALIMALGLDAVFTEADLVHAQKGEDELAVVLLKLIEHDWKISHPDGMPAMKQLHEAADGDIELLSKSLDWLYLNRLFNGAITKLEITSATKAT